MKLSLFILGTFLTTLGLALLGCFTTFHPAPLPNLYIVDAKRNIMRGAEPTAEGWSNLYRIYGIRNVVKLNTASEGSDDVARSLGMTVHEFPITTEQQLGLEPLREQYIRDAVSAVTENTFVHCGSEKRTASEIDKLIGRVGGQDRTGLICAFYRVLVMGWSKSDAHAEMIAFFMLAHPHAQQKALAATRAFARFALGSHSTKFIERLRSSQTYQMIQTTFAAFLRPTQGQMMGISQAIYPEGLHPPVLRGSWRPIVPLLRSGGASDSPAPTAPRAASGAFGRPR